MDQTQEISRKTQCLRNHTEPRLTVKIATNDRDAETSDPLLDQHNTINIRVDEDLTN